MAFTTKESSGNVIHGSVKIIAFPISESGNVLWLQEYISELCLLANQPTSTKKDFWKKLYRFYVNLVFMSTKLLALTSAWEDTSFTAVAEMKFTVN